MQALEILLRETLILTIYKKRSEWVHPLYEAHVRPTLIDHYQSMRLNLNAYERCVFEAFAVTVRKKQSSCLVVLQVNRHRRMT